MGSRGVSLCTGYGGLDAAAEEVLGMQTVANVEFDAQPSRIIAANAPDVPNLGDVKALTWVDYEPQIVTAGYPCQPFSNAGQRRGAADPRHLWPDIAEGVRRSRPEFVALENVRHHLKLGWSVVVADLDRLDYDVRWTLIRAADVGAPHSRSRLYALARNRDDGGWSVPDEPFAARVVDGEWWAPGDLFGARPYVGKPPASGAQVGGWVYPRRPVRRAAQPTLLPTPAVNDMGAGKTVEWWDDWCAHHKAKHGNGNGHGPSLAVEMLRLHPFSGCWGRYTAAVERWAALTRPAPAPLVDGSPPAISAAFVEWMMGLPSGWVTAPGIWSGMSDSTARAAQLKALGNGVVPQQARAAFLALLAET